MPSFTEQELYARIKEFGQGCINPYKLTDENWAMLKSLVYAEDSPAEDGWMNKIVEDLLDYPENFEYYYQRHKIELLAVDFFKTNNIQYNPDYPANKFAARFVLNGREFWFSVDHWKPIYSICTIIEKEPTWDQSEFDEEVDSACRDSQPPLKRGIDDTEGRPHNPLFILDQFCITPEEFRLQFPYSIKTMQDAIEQLYYHFSPKFQAWLERVNKKGSDDNPLPF